MKISGARKTRYTGTQVAPTKALQLPNADHLTLEEVERDHIIKALRDCDGVVTKAATRLGLHRTTLNAMMGKLGISRKDI